MDPIKFLSTRKDDSEEFKLYHYDPTVAGAAVMLVLFLGTTALHFWQLIRTRCWFLIPLATGGICEFSHVFQSRFDNFLQCDFDPQVEVIGYAMRCKSGQETPNWTLGPYAIQLILLLVAPALFAATIYMELGRIATLIDGEDRLLIHKRWMTKIFVGGDVLSFIIQAGGKYRKVLLNPLRDKCKRLINPFDRWWISILRLY